MKLNPTTVTWAFPPANLIAAPFVCPNGKMELETQGYQPSPVESVTVLTWYCVDPVTGGKTELGLFPMSLYAGAIYGFLLFGLVMAGMLIDAKRKSGGQAEGTEGVA